MIKTNENSNNNKQFNPLPDKYTSIIENSIGGNPYYCNIFEDYGVRELIIFKKNPTDAKSKLNFTVDIFSKEIKSTIKFKKRAKTYSYKGDTYGVYKTALPYIDINRIVIHKNKWKETLKPSFKILKNEYQIEKNKGSVEMTVNPYLPYFTTMLKLNNIPFIPYSYKVVDDKIFQTRKKLNEFCLNNESTVVIFNNIGEFWNLSDNKATKNMQIFGKNKDKVQTLIDSFINNKKSINDVFNVDLIADYIALRNVFTNDCSEKFYLIYDKNKQLSPFFVSSNCLGNTLRNLKKYNLSNFSKKYVQKLNEVTKIELNTKIKENKTIREELTLINKYDPTKIFDIEALNLNQRVIKKNLDVSKSLITELISINSNSINLLVSNNSLFPIKINQLLYKKKQIIPVNNFKLEANKQDTLNIKLPQSFENLFVSKKSKKVGFKLYKHIYELYLNYNIEGLNKKYSSSIQPYTQNEILKKEDIMRIHSTVKKFKSISVDEENKIIKFNKTNITINTPLIIPKDYQFKIEKGTTINIMNGGKIISYSPLEFIGTKDKPIKFTSSDKKGQGIIIFNSNESHLKFVDFQYLTNPEHGYWSVTGAISFYESPVILNNVTISKNTCEDALNIIRTHFKMENCTISNTQSDAFDGDFITGKIINSNFDFSGNDAIDVSGSNIKIKNVVITNVGDKGLSAGENSKMDVNNINIKNSEIAVASKDLSSIIINNITIQNTKLAFTAFQKKPEFGSSEILVNNATFKNVETKYLIEKSSLLKVDGKKIKGVENVKGRMYGVEFGVSSKETRKKKK